MTISLTNSEKSKIQEILKNYYPDKKYNNNELSIWELFVGILIKNKITITSAESCTGGLFAAHLTDCPGASKCFSSSLITYSNRSKIELLNINDELINNYGAVSVECAKMMAEGVLKITGSELAVSITGIAGPGGGSISKPVGTVCFCVAGFGIDYVKKCVFSGNRQMIREKSVYYALVMLLKGLNDHV